MSSHFPVRLKSGSPEPGDLSLQNASAEADQSEAAGGYLKVDLNTSRGPDSGRGGGRGGRGGGRFDGGRGGGRGRGGRDGKLIQNQTRILSR